MFSTIFYKLFIILLICNLILFTIYFKIASKIGFIDNSRKFNNPITPTSSGIIIYFNFLIILIINYFFQKNLLEPLPHNFFFTFIFLTLLVLISALDDIKPVDPKIRLFFQLICIYFSLTSIQLYLLDFPLKLSIIICLLLWVYILNITNFIDGSDGFLTINTIFVFINFIIIDYIFEISSFSKYLLFLLLPSLLTFLYFNKPSAKMYLGDSGSIFLGFIFGFIFLELIIVNKINLAISLLIYPLFDCSLALIRKALDHKLPWVDISNYSFLQPTIKKNKNKYFVFYFNIIFNFLNSICIFLQIFYGWYFIFLNCLLALIFITIYEKKN